MSNIYMYYCTDGAAKPLQQTWHCIARHYKTVGAGTASRDIYKTIGAGPVVLLRRRGRVAEHL